MQQMLCALHEDIDRSVQWMDRTAAFHRIRLSAPGGAESVCYENSPLKSSQAHLLTSQSAGKHPICAANETYGGHL